MSLSTGWSSLQATVDSWKERGEAIRQFRLREHQIEGTERASGERLRLSYLGTGNHLAYVEDWIFRQRAAAAPPRACSAWHARRWAATAGDASDLLIADLPSPYHRLLPRRRFVECPAWLNQRLAIGTTWTEVTSRFRRSAKRTAMRRIRKFGLEDRLTRAPAAAEEFYTELYVPHLRRRFGDAAFLEPRERIDWFVENGHLLQILRDGQVVAAAVLYGWGRVLEFLWVGLRGDLQDDTTAGAHGALYYYGILYAFEQGFDEIDLSGTRSLLNDGVYRFKRQWGASVRDGWCLDRLMVEPRRLSAAVVAFLERSPMIVRGGRGLEGRVFSLSAPPTVDDVHRIASQYSSDGITRMSLVCADTPPPAVIEAAAGNEVDLGFERPRESPAGPNR